MVLFHSVPRVDKVRRDVSDRGCNPACLILAAGMGPIAPEEAAETSGPGHTQEMHLDR
jgi:hypothetical protein